MDVYARDFGETWLEGEKARILVNPARALANGILNEHWRNGSEIENIHAGSIYAPRPLMQRRLTLEQEALLMRETTELFVPTMRALYNVVAKPSQETWPEQALPYAIAGYRLLTTGLCMSRLAKSCYRMQNRNSVSNIFR